MAKKRPDKGFPSAGEDATRARHFRATPQTLSSSYRLAFADEDFLLREELRPVRLQLELLKPELLLQESNIHSTIVVFGSARVPGPDQAVDAGTAPGTPAGGEVGPDATGPAPITRQSRHYEAAREFSRLASRAGQKGGRCDYVVVTGGGPGVMEAANRGASDVGAMSIGLNIVLPHEQVPNPYITPKLSFQFHYFALRKMHFLIRARALVVFPGGFGTLDELFDALTLIQTGKIDPMPILLFDEAWWRRIIDFDAMAQEGVIARQDLDLFEYVETPADAWARIAGYYESGSD